MTLVCVRIARNDVEVSEHAGGCTIDIGGGVLVRLTAVEQDMIRVAVRPSGGGPRLDRTWMVAPGLPTLPEEGRPKESTDDFAMPPTTLERTADDSVRLSTGRLRVTVPVAPGAPLCLTFGSLDEATGEWRLLMQDRPGGAYYFGAADGRAQHYIVRGRGDAYYGCGERSGALNLSGRRIDMRCVDAMGVRAAVRGAARVHVPGAARDVRACCSPRPPPRRPSCSRCCRSRCAWCAGSDKRQSQSWQGRLSAPPPLPPPPCPFRSMMPSARTHYTSTGHSTFARRSWPVPTPRAARSPLRRSARPRMVCLRGCARHAREAARRMASSTTPWLAPPSTLAPS